MNPCQRPTPNTLPSMKTPLLSLTLALAGVFTWSHSHASDVLTGDTRYACEAILCLASATRPTECRPSLSRYFSIVARNWSRTLQARHDFLNLCPVSQQTPAMSSLVSAIARGAGHCDAVALNQSLRLWSGSSGDGYTYISNQMPDYCTAYTRHAFTDFVSSGSIPRYVGDPLRGGYRVEGRDYERALAEYNAKLVQAVESDWSR